MKLHSFHLYERFQQRFVIQGLFSGREWRITLAAVLVLVGLNGSDLRQLRAQTVADDTVALGFHVHRGDGEHMAAAAAAGAKFVVLVFSWEDMEPEPNYLYWERTDAALRAAEVYGVGIVARLDRPPAWAHTDSGETPWRLDAYGAFVARVVQRYGARLDGVILWNEPNLALEWAGRTPSAAGYVALLQAGYEAVKAHAPDLPVLMAGLAFTQGDGVNAINDLAYLEEVYALGGGAYFDVLAAHPYGFGAPPEDEPDARVLNFRRLELHRALMEANGDRAKPVWITEMGWRSRAPDRADDWQVVASSLQRDYTLGAINFTARNLPWVERLALWELIDGPDLYGYALWQGEGRITATYAALVSRHAATCETEGCKAPGLEAAPRATIGILGADVAVRLGDIGTLHPHWIHLYAGGDRFSPAWRGEFFVVETEVAREYRLVLETMQLDQPTSRVTLNGVDIGKLLPRTRPDPTSTWSTQRLVLPRDLLRPGQNWVQVDSGLRNPARQYGDWRWENFQFRNVRLEPVAATAGQSLYAWTRAESPPGWGEVNRIRPFAQADGTTDIWVTTNRAGGLWRGTIDGTEKLSSFAKEPGLPSHLVITDLLQVDEMLVAATDQGLWQRATAGGAWAAVAGVPARQAYFVVAAGGYHWAGFEQGGVWRANPGGAWQVHGLYGETVLDLLADGAGTLYAATARGVYTMTSVGWQRLPDLPTRADADAGDAAFSGRLFPHRTESELSNGVVARAQDVLWAWNGVFWRAVGPENLVGQATVVVDCCAGKSLVGTNQRGLWWLEDGRWSLTARGFFDDLEVTAGVRVGEMTLLGTTTGLFWRDSAGEWRAAQGFAPVISALVTDPANGQGLYAGTPVGVYFQAAIDASWQAISPPWVVWDMVMDATGRLFVARGDGLAWADDPRAENWQTSTGMESVTFFGVEPNPVDPKQVWAGTWGNDIGVSADQGASVRPLHNGLETLSALDVWWHATPGQITIGTIEGLYRSDDGGESWFKLPGALQQQTVYAVRQNDAGLLWAGAADGLWVSPDFGITWERRPDLPPVTVNRLGRFVVNELPVLWAGTEAEGVWLSFDDGFIWEFGGLAGRSVYGLVVRDNNLLAATDQGMYRTDLETVE